MGGNPLGYGPASMPTMPDHQAAKAKGNDPVDRMLVEGSFRVLRPFFSLAPARHRWDPRIRGAGNNGVLNYFAITPCI